MKLFMKKYDLVGWNKKTYHMTAEQIHKRIMEDSKSNYNWLAPATSLVKVCNEPDFPLEYAIDIKLAILNCFTHLEKYPDDFSSRLKTDNDAVYDCYNSLYGIKDENVIQARKNYLYVIIENVSMYHFELPIHIGKTYFKICKEWEEKKFKESYSQKYIDFKALISDLHKDYDTTIKNAEKEGLFKEEDEQMKKNLLEFTSKLINDFNE